MLFEKFKNINTPVSYTVAIARIMMAQNFTITTPPVILPYFCLRESPDIAWCLLVMISPGIAKSFI